MKKRVLALILAMLMLASAAACAETADNNVQSSEEVTTEEPAAPSCIMVGEKPITDYTIVVPAGSATDRKAAEGINKWLSEKEGLTLTIAEGAAETECEILIGNTGRAQSAKYYTGDSALKEGTYAVASEGAKLVLAYNGFGNLMADHFIEAVGDARKIENLSVIRAESPEALFRYDNFAEGKWTEELLNSVTPGALAILSECTYFQARLLEGVEKGEKWVYSNSSSYVPQNGTFDAMVKTRQFGSNCALPQAWILTELKVLPTGHLYGNSAGEIAGITSQGKYLAAVADMTRWGGRYEFCDLYKNGKVQPGDIFFCSGHTFIFLGDDTFMAAGHDGKWHTDETARTEDSRKAVFESWFMPMESCMNYNYKVYYQVRFKDEFVPMYYRNTAGKLILNPMYNPDTSIMYKEGVSRDTYKFIAGRLDG